MAIKVPLPELNTVIETDTELVYTTTDPISTVATLYMPVESFRSMFDYTDGALKFDSSAAESLKTVCKQQSISNGESYSDNSANLLDSFKITTSVVNDTSMESNRNILEHCLLEHAFEKFGFIDAFVAFDQVSRTSVVQELYSEGESALNGICDKLDASGNNVDVAANLLLSISKLRTLGDSADKSNLFQIGDSYHFSLTISNTTTGFKTQQYNCQIVLVDNLSALATTRCERYSIGLSNSLYLVEQVPTAVY